MRECRNREMPVYILLLAFLLSLIGPLPAWGTVTPGSGSSGWGKEAYYITQKHFLPEKHLNTDAINPTGIDLLSNKPIPQSITSQVIPRLAAQDQQSSPGNKETNTNQQNNSTPETVTKTFTDLTAKDPNWAFITYIKQRGIINGFSDGSYHPQAGLTRAQAAAVICKAAGLQTPVVNTASFKDLPRNHWALAYINAAVKAGYLKGFPDGSYQPEKELTRAQGISLIMRLSQQGDSGVALPQLSDMTSSHWAARAMAMAIDAGMINTQGNSIQPDSPINRGDISRALAVLLTSDPQLSSRQLYSTLQVNSGEVFLSGGSQEASKVTGNPQVGVGDTIETMSNGSAVINYPDGSSLLLRGGSILTIKESQGRAYIKKDGQPGTAVDNLVVELKVGKMFGGLSSLAQPNTAASETPASTTGMNNQESKLLASTAARYDLLAAGGAIATPWYKTAQKEKVKVKVDMPWGVAAIRGSFWNNAVNADGSGSTTLLEGSASVSAGGQSVSLSPGESSGGSEGGGAPSAPAPMSAVQLNDWAQAQSWVQSTFSDMSDNQGASAPGNEGSQESETASSDPASTVSQAISQALSQATSSVPGSSGSSSGGGGGGSTDSTIIYASTPSSIILGSGSVHPVGGVKNVAIPAPGATDTTGAVTGWICSTADTIKFTVIDTPEATSAITINGASYTSGDDYSIGSTANLTIVVTTTETGKTTGVRTFTITVSPAAAQTTPTFSPPAGAIAFGTTVTINSAGADAIYYTTDGSDPSTASTNQATTALVINSTVIVKAMAVKAGLNNSAIGIAEYTQATAKTPGTINLAPGNANPVGGVTDVAIPANGATDTTGAVIGWDVATANTIKFTVADIAPTVSTITINGSPYTSGADYVISAASTLTIVVTSVETGKISAVRTFVISVTDDISGGFTDPIFKQAVWTWLGNTGTPGAFTHQDLCNRMAAQSNTFSVTHSNIVSAAGLEYFQGTGVTRLEFFWDPLLTSLPALPSSLTALYCDYSGLTSLPVLPNGMTELYFNNNHITSLPSSFTGLGGGLAGSCDGNYLNIWEPSLQTMLAAYSGFNSTKTPQFRCSYTGPGVSIIAAGTYQLSTADLVRQQTSDGSTWGAVTNGSVPALAIGDFTFSSDNPAVAAVAPGGLISATGAGTCNIYADYLGINAQFTRAVIPVSVTP